MPLLKRSGRGVIVLVSSGASVQGSSSYAYGTSKGGVDALGVTLAAKHEADNIRVNVVRLGVRTATIGDGDGARIPMLWHKLGRIRTNYWLPANDRAVLVRGDGIGLAALSGENGAASAFPGQFLGQWLGPTTLLFLARSTQRASTLSPLSLAEATGLLIAQSGALTLECHPNPHQHLDLLARLASRSTFARLELGSEWLEDPSSAAQSLCARVSAFFPNRPHRSQVL